MKAHRYKMRLWVLSLIFIACAGAAHAERRYTLGSQLNFVAGGTNQQTLSSIQFQKGLAPFYGFYPTVDILSAGQTTQVNLSYSALLERYVGDQSFTSNSNLARVGFLKKGQRYKLEFNASFSDSPEDLLINVITGTVPEANGFRFLFQPSRTQSSRQAIYGGAGTEVTLSERSYLSFDFLAASLNYYDINAPPNTDPNSLLFLDQIRKEGRLGYAYKLDGSHVASVHYIYTDTSFGGHGIGKTQGVAFTYATQINPALQFTVTGGPAFLSGRLEPVSVGYIAAARVMRRLGSSNLAAYYNHGSGDGTGLGSLSNIHSTGFNMSSPLSRKIAIGVGISSFIGAGGSGVGRYTGVYSAADLSYELGRRWYVSLGGEYRFNSNNSPLDQDFKRIFVSLRFRAPDLWRSLL
jgi:hypothetical protein